MPILFAGTLRGPDHLCCGCRNRCTGKTCYWKDKDNLWRAGAHNLHHWGKQSAWALYKVVESKVPCKLLNVRLIQGSTTFSSLVYSGKINFFWKALLAWIKISFGSKKQEKNRSFFVLHIQKSLEMVSFKLICDSKCQGLGSLYLLIVALSCAISIL